MTSKVVFACLAFLLVVSVASCRQTYAGTSGAPTSLPAEDDPLAFLKWAATGTALAQTQVARQGYDPMGTLQSFATGTAQAQLAGVSTPGTISNDHESLIPVLMVVLPDGTQQTFTYSLLEQYATLTLDLFDLPRKAVDLRFLLEQAGWQYHQVFSVTFEGRTSMTFSIDRLPEGAALYIDDRTFNFVSDDIPVDEWPRDVILIVLH